MTQPIQEPLRTLQDIGPGERVLLHDGYENLSAPIVAKVTKLHIILESGAKYQRSGGRQVHGDTWHSSSIEPLTPDGMKRLKEQQEENKRLKAARLLNDFDFKLLNMNQLERITAITKEVRL